jgi:hypothetical protein
MERRVAQPATRYNSCVISLRRVSPFICSGAPDPAGQGQSAAAAHPDEMLQRLGETPQKLAEPARSAALFSRPSVSTLRCPMWYRESGDECPMKIISSEPVELPTQAASDE